MGGAFKGRNLYYLRLKGTVLPLYVSTFRTHSLRLFTLYQVFLDEKHIDWMNDITLQRVLSDLRPQSVLKTSWTII